MVGFTNSFIKHGSILKHNDIGHEKKNTISFYYIQQIKICNRIHHIKLIPQPNIAEDVKVQRGLTSSGQCPVICSYQQHNEPLDSKKGRELLHQVKNYELITKDYSLK
jgi:hypothetical protein